MSAGHPLRAALDDALQHPAAATWPRLDESARGRLLAYVDLLARWNRAYNLTAVREPREMLTRHLLDSLSIAPLVSGERVLDVGTGAGLPGLVLAIALPESHCVLVDAVMKKTRFCTQAALELGLVNVDVRHDRVESLRDAGTFDTVVARAVTDVATLWRASRPLLRVGGRLLVMKGRLPRDELEEVAAMGENPQSVAVQVPGLDEQRHAIVVTRGDDAGRLDGVT